LLFFAFGHTTPVKFLTLQRNQRPKTLLLGPYLALTKKSPQGLTWPAQLREDAPS